MNHSNIATISHQFASIISKANATSTSKLMQLFPYDPVVPCCIWFHDDQYHTATTKDDIRLRYYRGHLLNNVSSKQHAISPQASIYEAVYSESFHFHLEAFHTIRPVLTSCCFIGSHYNQGMMEALMMYQEITNPIDYQFNTYHCHLTDDAVVGNDAQLLKTTFVIEYQPELPSNTYDLLLVDTIPWLDKPMLWSSQVQDRSTLKSVVNMIPSQLNRNATAIIRLNMLDTDYDSIDLDAVCQVSKHFKSANVYRPTFVHKYDSKLLVILNDYLGLEESSEQVSSQSCVLKDQVLTFKLKWMEQLVTDAYNYPSIDLWNTTMGTITIGMMKPIDVKVFEHALVVQVHDVDETNDNDSEVTTPIPSTTLTNISHLNYYKRMMDSKPTNLANTTSLQSIIGKLNPYQSLRKVISTKHKTPFVTIAWMKLYEILSMNLIAFSTLISNNTIKSFHICEAPGSFVYALQFYINHGATTGAIVNRNKPNITLNWKAQTLDLDTQVGLGDHHGNITGNKNWFIGDITQPQTLERYITDPQLQDIMFMTGDGGQLVNKNRYNEQEAVSYDIIKSEIITILSVLAHGGSAILKIYLPFMQLANVSLMAIVTRVFDKVHVVKPMASHNINSEVYMVMVGYNKNNFDLLKELKGYMTDSNVTAPLTPIDAFIGSHSKSMDKLMQRQIQALNYHYHYYYDDLTDWKRIEKINGHLKAKWLTRVGL